MSRLEFSPAAARDLVDISCYIAADDPGRAATLVEKLELRCLQFIGARRAIGSPRSFFRPPLPG